MEELDSAKPPPGEPRLSAIARQLLSRGISGKELSQLEDAWLALLQPFPWGELQAENLRLRGQILFGVGARLLGGDREDAEAAGAFWSLADGAAHCSDAPSREFLLKGARAALAELPPKFSREIRPLTVLSAIAAHDMLRSGRLTRVGVALAHRLRGTMPRS